MRVLKRETQLLATELTPEEFTAKAVALAETHEKLALERELQKEAKADMKQRIEELEQKRNTLARVVQRRKEDRLVDVEIKADDAQGIARVVRLDTGEVVEERPLSAGERQLGLSLVPDPLEDPTGPKPTKGNRQPTQIH